MNYLQAEQYIITTNTGLQLRVTREEANRINKIWVSSPSAPVQVRHASGYSTCIVRAIETAAQREEARRLKRGEWKCKMGNWHLPGEPCRCNDPSRKFTKIREYPKPNSRKWCFSLLVGEYMNKHTDYQSVKKSRVWEFLDSTEQKEISLVFHEQAYDLLLVDLLEWGDGDKPDRLTEALKAKKLDRKTVDDIEAYVIDRKELGEARENIDEILKTIKTTT